jgi:RNA polymerase sigma-B factor
MIGLLVAIDRFDPDRGARFTAFAIPTILGEIKRYFRDTGWMVHVPRGAQEMALRVDRAIKEMATRTGEAPRVDAIAQYLEVDVADVLTGLDAGGAHFSASLDAPVGGQDDEFATLRDCWGAEDEGFALIDAKLSCAAAIARLPHAERQVLRLRLDHDLKQSEIAQRLGCSQMQVSRLLRRASESCRRLLDPELNGPG